MKRKTKKVLLIVITLIMAISVAPVYDLNDIGFYVTAVCTGAFIFVGLNLKQSK